MKFLWLMTLLPVIVTTAACSGSNNGALVSDQTQEDDSEVIIAVTDVSVPEEIFFLPETATCDASVEPTVHDYSFEVRGAEFIFYITVEKNQSDTDGDARWIAAQIEWGGSQNELSAVPFVVYAPFTISIDESVITFATTPHNEIETEESLQVALIRMSASRELCWTAFMTQEVTVSEHLSNQENTESDSVDDTAVGVNGVVSDDMQAQEVLSVESEDRSQDGHEYFVVSVGLRLLEPMYVCLAHESNGERSLLINAGSHIGLLPEGESYVEFWISHAEVSLYDADMLFLMGSPDGECYAEMNQDSLTLIE